MIAKPSPKDTQQLTPPVAVEIREVQLADGVRRSRCLTRE